MDNFDNYKTFVKYVIDNNFNQVKTMIDKGYNPNYLPKGCLHPFHYSLITENTDIIDILLINDVKINYDINGKNALFYLALKEKVNINLFKYFLDKNINVNFVDCNNKTLIESLVGEDRLFRCSYSDRVKMIELLVEYDADITFNIFIKSCLFNQDYLIKLFIKNYIFNDFKIVYNMGAINLESLMLMNRLKNFKKIVKMNRDFFLNTTDDEVSLYIDLILKGV